MDIICKTYGIIDILTALTIFFMLPLPGIIKIMIIIILVFKGISSIFGNIICKLYGIADIIAACVFFFGIVVPDTIKVVLVAIFLIKGVPSLMG